MTLKTATTGAPAAIGAQIRADLLGPELKPHPIISHPLRQEAEEKLLKWERFFTKNGVHPYDEITWEKRSAVISNEKGEKVFAQENAEIPSFWSQSAANIVVSKYFRGQLGTAGRETSVRQMIDRVAKTITEWGRQADYFHGNDAQIFEEELTYLLVYQKAAFNSPVWFNVGIREHPQCSACFILSIEDTMDSILGWIRAEGIIFKNGSGSGINLSKLRSSREPLSVGGTASGPVSFMRGADASAGAIKSGGATRRAAKMVVLNVDHPDIMEFIDSKANEEKKAWALGEAGYDMSLNGEAWKSIQFQNANNSVRVTDEFMRAAESNGTFKTRAVLTGEPMDTYPAMVIMSKISEAAWLCGDPGMQFDTNVNDWHTCPNSGRINASNPCSEYMHLDDSACNLASINIMKFVDEDTGEFNVIEFKKAVDVMITAQEIIVDFSSYPTEKITKNARDFRELGLGYANLGAYLMLRGFPYDSDEGRALAANITAIMTGEAYLQSAKIAQKKGPFAGYGVNREPMLRVIRKHWEKAKEIHNAAALSALKQEAAAVWEEAYKLGEIYGYRNSQATVLAPTGTISFLMDCDTTGIEPDIALVKYKVLVGGGLMKLINKTVPLALKRLGYADAEVKDVIDFINENDTIEGAPHLKNEHLAVFDCAFRPQNGSRSIHYLGHIRMMGAVQPFISGAISKTVNLPSHITPEDIADTYIEAWKHGLKAIAVYRDGSKKTQPLSTSSRTENKVMKEEIVQKPLRRRLPDERQSVTHKFSIANHEGYITVGLYEDDKPGEIFVTMAKEGSVISGLMNSFATAISIALQYGVPLKVLANKFIHSRFEPAGFTNHPKIQVAKSIVDYIFRWLALKFLPQEELGQIGFNAIDTLESPSPNQLKIIEADEIKKPTSLFTFDQQSDAPACDNCGAMMVRNAACYKCLNCGNSSGCS